MRRNTLKLLAFTCVAALGATVVSSNTFAQGTINLPITLGSESTFTVTLGDTMDFGTWFLHHDTNDITLVMAAATGVVAETAVAPSQAVEVTAGATPGSITVATPAAATIEVHAVINDDWGTNAAAYEVSDPTYDWAGATAAGALSIVPGTPTSLSTADSSDHVLLLGATVTVEAQPTDAADTATLDVVFAYP